MPTGIGGEELWLLATEPNSYKVDYSPNGHTVAGSYIRTELDPESGLPCFTLRDGTQDGMNCNPAMPTAYPFSISCFLKRKPAENMYISISDESTIDYYLLCGETGAQIVKTDIRVGGSTITASGGDTSGQDWIHITSVFETDSLRRTYLNGVLVATSTTSAPTNFANFDNLWLGRLARSTTLFYKGSWNDFRMFYRVLLDQEIVDLASVQGYQPPPPALVEHDIEIGQQWNSNKASSYQINLPEGDPNYSIGTGARNISSAGQTVTFKPVAGEFIFGSETQIQYETIDVQIAPNREALFVYRVGYGWVLLNEQDMVQRWRGPWEDRTYHRGDVVLDDGWLMIANQTTNDRPAPLAQGDPTFGYTGADPTADTSAKQLIQGQRYTTIQPAFITGFRVYTIAGNQYTIYSVIDGTDINQIMVINADSTGWIPFNTGKTPVPAGTVFDLVAITSEPDPTPVVWNGEWNYTTPNNAGIPAAGDISHSSKELGSLRVHILDDSPADRQAELLALTVGDIINGPGGVRWSIQGLTDEATYVDFSIVPAQQGSPAGVFDFSFETVTATPITHISDKNFWVPYDNVNGLIGIDVDYDDVTINDNQYGIDIQFQPATVSSEWDVQAYSEALGSDSI